MQKLVLTILVFVVSLSTKAQWLNTNNSFTDNNHLPVSIANADQTYPISTVSYFDSSVIVAWIDNRNGNNDIYAQKFDKNGNAVWATNGIAVATGSESQTYYTGGINYQPQFYSFMATDSAGGFYIAWEDANTSVGNNKNKICIQHVKADGSLVFGASGYTIASPSVTDNFYFTKPQLIADGMGGFFVSYIQNYTDRQYIAVACYKDINGTLKSFGGGATMNDFIETYTTSTGCSGLVNTLVRNVNSTVSDYQLTTNQQKGCIVVFKINTTSTGLEYIGSNQLIRVKKNCLVTRYPSNASFTNMAAQTNQQSYNYFNYKKDTVIVMNATHYFTRSDFVCSTIGNPTGYARTTSIISNMGFDVIRNNNASIYGSLFSFPKVVFLPASGNITPSVYTWYQKNIATNDVPLLDTFCRYQLYDSVPYQLATDTANLIPSITPPIGLKKIKTITDSLLASNTHGYLYNYQLISANNSVYLALKSRSFTNNANINSIYLQKLKLENVAADSCQFKLESPSKQGREVGKDVNTGFQVSSIFLNNPGISINTNGDAMYYVSEYYRYMRVSPIGDSCKLLWGANGKPIGTGYIGTSPYLPQNPSAVFMPNNQRVAMFWQENYRTTYTGTGENIMLRNIDSLPNNVLPARKLISLLTTAPNTGSFSLLPQNLLGTSNSYTSFEVINGTGTQQNTLVAEVLDNDNLGAVYINVYQHSGTVRQTGGTYYLNRNYSITPTNQPTTPITVRLFFTTEEYNALKTADPLITSVGNLAVTKLSGNTAPATFPGGAAQLIIPEDWQAVNGGFYLQFKVSSFSSFWIHRNTNTALPATLGNVWVSCNNNLPTLHFNTIAENNLKLFEVEQYSNNNWQKQFTITAQNISSGFSYNQVLNAASLYRLKIVDKDNNYNYSKTINVSCNKQNIGLSAYPNPVKDHLNITVSATGGILKLFSSTGKLMLQQTISQNNSNISVSKYAAGIYTLTYQQKDGTITKQTITKQ